MAFQGRLTRAVGSLVFSGAAFFLFLAACGETPTRQFGDALTGGSGGLGAGGQVGMGHFSGANGLGGGSSGGSSATGGLGAGGEVGVGPSNGSGGVSGGDGLGSLGGAEALGGALSSGGSVPTGGTGAGGARASSSGGSAGQAVAGSLGASGSAGQPPAGACTPAARRSCGDAGLLGSCALGVQTCGADQNWGTCSVLSKAKDSCAPGNDDSCNGIANEGCACVIGSDRACVGALGNCASGRQSCPNGTWSACSVLPKAADVCTPGDDSNCNGVLNEGCNCVSGSTQACGPAAVGVCKPGKSTCSAGVWGTCVGQVPAGSRDCGSSADNDCNGIADNTIDSVCQCAPTKREACQAHPGLDGIGICRVGSRVCNSSSDKSTSSWADCLGYVGPGTRNCTSSADNDCNGVLDNVKDAICQCTPNAQQTCGTHPGLDGKGICKAGSQTCTLASNGASSSWGTTCPGSTGPQPADRCDVAGDDSNCDGVPNEGCCAVRACGTTCCGAAPPNTTPGCSGQVCTSACTSPLSCSTTDGHFCGSWNFSSNDSQFEGWRVDTSNPSSINATLSYSQGRLAASFSTAGQAALHLTTSLCAAGTANVTGKTFHAELAVNPPSPAANPFLLDVYPNLRSPAGLDQVDADEFLSSTLTFNVTNLPSFDATTLEFEIDVTAAFTGTLYLDNVSFK